ncbi:MAG: hypothetical protein JJT89_04205 [Nitriliruptoraceae bacterium]|nr:hypothetical protein [Nitriliruptoraceae bacterium]
MTDGPPEHDPDAIHGIDPDAIHGIDPDAIHGIDDHALRGSAERLSGGIALGAATLMHLTVGLFVWFTGLLAPMPVALALVALWVALAVTIWRWHRRRPLWTLVVPFAMAGVWFATITLGDQLLGWTR